MKSAGIATGFKVTLYEGGGFGVMHRKRPDFGADHCKIENQKEQDEKAGKAQPAAESRFSGRIFGQGLIFEGVHRLQ